MTLAREEYKELVGKSTESSEDSEIEDVNGVLADDYINDFLTVYAKLKTGNLVKDDTKYFDRMYFRFAYFRFGLFDDFF